MRNTLALTLAFSAVACQSAHDERVAHAPRATEPAPALAPDERMAWWREARFGLFVHWGLYALPAGSWDDRTDHGEWIRDTAHITRGDYEALATRFEAPNFDADSWVSAAKSAGMSYVVVTSKHHDGFCLWDSAQTDWDVGRTPFQRDVLAELSAACARAGLRFGTYHSIMDWHHPDYVPRREWETTDVERAAHASFDRYEAYLRAQVTELVERYHPSVMWFDGEWEHTWTHARGVRLFELCRTLDPALIVNNRVDVFRAGTEGFARAPEARGDFQTPEQEIPAAAARGTDWETCLTLNDHWGWNASDTHWKSGDEIVRTLAETASKGGNLLLNVGPRADGTFPPEALERLAHVGRWMDVNAASIRGTQASPFDSPFAFGRVTSRANTLYLHVFAWPADGVLALPGLANTPRAAHLLADPGRTLRTERGEGGVRVVLGGSAPDTADSVVALELDDAPRVIAPPAIEAPAELFVEELLVTLTSHAPRTLVRYTLDGSEPGATSTVYRGPFLLLDSAVVRARTFASGEPASGSSARTFTRATPRPAFYPAGRRAGIVCEHFSGEFDALPDFATLTPNARYIVPVVALPKGPPEERVARRFTGFVQLPHTAVWEFALASDDGSKLYLDDACIVDNDGLHGSRERTGQVALARGAHKLRVEWFNRTGGAQLELRMAEAGRALRPIETAELGREPPVAGEEGNVIETESGPRGETLPGAAAAATDAPAAETSTPDPKPADAQPPH